MATHELLWVIHYVKTVVNYHEFPGLLALSCWAPGRIRIEIQCKVTILVCEENFNNKYLI